MMKLEEVCERFFFFGMDGFVEGGFEVLDESTEVCTFVTCTL